MSGEEADTIRDQADLLRQHLTDDLKNASTRIEHIRISQLAAEAERLVQAIDILREAR